ncbi:MAG: peptide ABC transporter substrate-binding protein [Candidatus Paceibacterota bacterium]
MKTDANYRGFLTSIKNIKIIFLSLPFKIKMVVVFLFILGTGTLFSYLQLINTDYLTEVPVVAGSITEGVIGTPRFINPLLASSDVDRDLSTLIYSGLMRKKTDGSLILDLAQDYTITEDKQTYNFILKNNLTWHDDKPLTTSDIAYTIEAIKNREIGHPNQALWNNINVEVKNDREITFSLAKPFPGFLDMATLGILPKHLWQETEFNNFTFSDFNIKPIGSGPYKINKIKKDVAGIPTIYELTLFKNFSLNGPYIQEVNFRFYPNEQLLFEAYKNNDIDSLSNISPYFVDTLRLKGKRIITTPLPRVFGLFFNQNQNPVFTQKEVREALNIAIDKDYIVKNILNGYGTVVNGPLSPQTFGYEAAPSTNVSDRTQTAAQKLLAGGWKKNEAGLLSKNINGSDTLLKFTITTAESEELQKIANFIKTEWEKIGASVDIMVLNQNALKEEAIRPRKYDVLFFGMVISNETDLYSFWHSSGRNDPGLNVSLYTSVNTDSLLDKLESTSDQNLKRDLVRQIQTSIVTDSPAIFLYSPYFIYTTKDNIQNINMEYIIKSSDRLLGIHNWHTETERVWPIFNQ